MSQKSFLVRTPYHSAKGWDGVKNEIIQLEKTKRSKTEGVRLSPTGGYTHHRRHSSALGSQPHGTATLQGETLGVRLPSEGLFWDAISGY